jgi:alkylated DNA repair dioxygenase AlkB/ubiquinone/menaquinone biosynthesis C-methylase UbiE
VKNLVVGSKIEEHHISRKNYNRHRQIIFMLSHAQHTQQFRSVLPHEPLPQEAVGYIHLQGAYEPKKKDPEAPNFWKSSETLEHVLRGQLIERYSALNLPYPTTSLEVIDPSHLPFTKVRLTYASPAHAIAVQHAWRQYKLSPSQLFAGTTTDPMPFSSGSFQVTVVTTFALLGDPSSSCWTRSNPPKFRRLLHGHADDDERRHTRFICVSGLLPDPGNKDAETTPSSNSFWDRSYAAVDAIRQVFNQFDSSGFGVEVFLSKKQLLTCHVGMRSSLDCQQVLAKLQGTTVTWRYKEEHISSGTLFLDYASVTHKSLAKSKTSTKGEEWERGLPSRPECTSTTDSIQIPGLVVVEDYLTEDQEQVLMAALTGPQAPWAPSQTNKSKTGAVKRLVQHYGYVFDYQTANVLRDRDGPGANCPILPQPEDDNPTNAQTRAEQGHGWQTLADVIDQTRRHAFIIPDGTTDEKIDPVSYPHLNQLTINHYKPGEGIGSHVDTPSAFGDGLISISLNGGIVMEFRKVQSATDTTDPVKKYVYLPPRSLVLMSGPARYEWEHHIVTRRTDTHNGNVLTRKLRVSLTLRTALTLDGKPMPIVQSREYPPKWGSEEQGDRSTSSKGLATPATERDHVHAVYDAIATQWHHTRGKRGVLWPGATQFLQRLPPGSVVADCGCGDGKYFPAIIEAGSYVIGTDISRPLLETAFLRDDQSSTSASKNGTIPDLRKVSAHREYLRDRPAVAVADCMSIPLRDKSCDAAICIAVMHHLSTKERRIRCIEELARVVRAGGMINIQAWAMEQDESSRRKFAGADVFVPFNAQPKYLDKVSHEKELAKSTTVETSGNKSVAEMYSEAYEKADFDERKGLVVFQRYCHLYRKGEMEEIIERIDGVKLVEAGYESGNHFVILEVVH